MKDLELFYLIIRKTKMKPFLMTFLAVFLIASVLVWLVDPSIKSLYDGIWFCFTVCTTIGFGDFTVTSWIGRAIVIVLGIYGITLSGFVCGIGASYLFAKVQMAKDESVSEMIWQLEHLDRLSDAQKKGLKQKVQAEQKRQDARSVQIEN